MTQMSSSKDTTGPHEILLPSTASKNCILLIKVLINGHLSFSRELVERLHERNIKVFLISGGFRCIVEHVAAQLNIPLHHVYANRLKFYFNGESLTWRVCDSRELIVRHRLQFSKLNYTCLFFSGEYAGFDETQPTAESGGKGKVISMLKEQYGFKTVVMIGDGATDLEACPPAVSVHTDSVHTW